MWQQENSQGSERSDASTALTLLASTAASSQPSSAEHLLPSPSTASSLEPSSMIRPETLFPSSSESDVSSVSSESV